jgi:proteasome assembly chaperone (PAC2) family protein
VLSDLDFLKFESKPSLRKPYLVCGLNGSFNGGNVSVGGVDYFISQFGAVKFAEMPASRYHIYQIPGVDSMRPGFKMQEGLIVEANLPTNEFYYTTNTGSEHDLILLRGYEPALNWEEYAENVVDLARYFGAVRLYTMCGLLDMTPYTREPIISCTCTDSKVKQEMEYFQITYSNREGMASYGQMLIHTCQKKGLEGVNFTVRVPCYPEFNVFLVDCPKSLKAILVRLKDLMHFNMNFNELDAVIKEIEEKLNIIRQQNPNFNALLNELEKKFVDMPYHESLGISPSDAVRLAEEFLKNNKE